LWAGCARGARKRRRLCGLAKAFRRHPTVPLSVLPEGERMLIRALATVDVEMYLLEMLAAFPNEANPMQRLDPCGVGLVAPDDAAAGQTPAGFADPAKEA
jgi:hypothetical protein